MKSGRTLCRFWFLSQNLTGLALFARVKLKRTRPSMKVLSIQQHARDTLRYHPKDWAGICVLVGGLGWQLVVRLLTLGCDCGLHRVVTGSRAAGNQGQVLLAGMACAGGLWLVPTTEDVAAVLTAQGGDSTGNVARGAAQRRIWGEASDWVEQGLHRDVGRRAVQRWRLVAIGLRSLNSAKPSAARSDTSCGSMTAYPRPNSYQSRLGLMEFPELVIMVVKYMWVSGSLLGCTMLYACNKSKALKGSPSLCINASTASQTKLTENCMKENMLTKTTTASTQPQRPSNVYLVLVPCRFLLGAVLNTLAWNLAMLLVGRIMLCFGFGFANQPVPLYLSETAPSHLTGGLDMMFQLATTLEIFTANMIKYRTAKLRPWGWQLSLGLAAAPALLMTYGFDGNASLYSSAVTGTVLASSALVSIATVDRWGRRALHIGGGIQMIICLLKWTRSPEKGNSCYLQPRLITDSSFSCIGESETGYRGCNLGTQIWQQHRILKRLLSLGGGNFLPIRGSIQVVVGPARVDGTEQDIPVGHVRQAIASQWL
ncbi:sugar transporter protein 7 [Actinidia rufa]|uniref:Sugar transporter protein 7 n=1 Tax=Actinidia rufa TaxID=165716 RepID=A0A7J0E2R9_9ERIC|nr:sugar transporter protein 7 [Actinidia rufa]